MDPHDSSRRQYAPQSYLPHPSQTANPAQQQQQRQRQLQQQHQHPHPHQQQQQHHHLPSQPPPQQGTPVQYATPGSSSTRLRPSPYQQPSPTTLPSFSSSARASSDVHHHQQQPVYAFAPTAAYDAGAGMQYSPELSAPDVSRQQHHHQQQHTGYPAYTGGLMSSLTQSHATPPTAASYDALAQYRHRTSGGGGGALDGLASSPFGVPQPQAQYYSAAAAGAATGSELAPAPSLAAPTYAHPDYTTPSAATSYPTMMETSPTGSYATYAQQQQPQHSPYASQHPQHFPQQHQQQHQQQQQRQQQTQPIPHDGEIFERCQAQLRNVFTLARDGALNEVPPILISASQSLLTTAEATGLTRDDETQHDARIRLWDEFNHAWLAALQRQLDMSAETTPPQQYGGGSRTLRAAPQSLMTVAQLDYLGRQLIALCDGVERHGLVDYQMGVAEEEILDLILRCTRVSEPSTSPSSSRAGPSARDPGPS